MRRFLVSFIMSCLLVGQSFSVAQANCQHRSAHDHAVARQSRDGKVAAAARAEETAATVVEKKGAVAADAPSISLAVMVPAASFVREGRSVDLLPWPRTAGPPLSSSTNRPLLRPPLSQS